MSNQLPDRPNLRHLKDEAKDLVKSGKAASIAKAQFAVARLYGFASWPKLKAHIDSLEETGQLKQAIEREDLAAVKALMTRNPALHRAPLGYGNNGPLTWVAECRVPWGPPSAERLAIARWMLENGSDVHQGSDGPLMRAALRGERIPMMELLVAYGANVNAEWNGDFPILWAPCESVNPLALKWLLDHGAHPNTPTTTALDYLLGTYGRSPELGTCIDHLVQAGGTSRYDVPGLMDLLRGDIDAVVRRLDADPALVHRRFPEFDFGSTGARRLLLTGATLLHVAAEFGNVAAGRLLLERGADPNVRAEPDGQTPIFHCVTQFNDYGLGMTRLLLENGADLSVRVTLPGHYDRPEEFVDCTPLGYATRYPGDELPNAQTIALLQQHGAVE